MQTTTLLLMHVKKHEKLIYLILLLDPRQEVVDIWWASGRDLDREHEHSAGRQQEVVSDVGWDHPDVSPYELDIRTPGLGSCFTRNCE